MIRTLYFLSIISTFSFGSIPDIERHSFDKAKLKELGFSQVTYVNTKAEEIQPYIFIFPSEYDENFVIQSVTLTAISNGKLLFSTLLDVSKADIEGYSSSFFYIKDKMLTYKLEVMYDTSEKETPYIRKGHIIEIENFLTLPVKKYQDLF
ncbi:hypothetical protein KO505_04500 [Psychrosphaera sp. F3M07]|uniref:hypothetical protein n=1 Tax=Psychrosphaera sp. F3M07 TaxID=2841560 RepID=UPI001C08F029|nr:hypothetical protein [Psychrosphaera sp. F3M07]MBU2917225.1 hypothetical protein [Psychrosphaera sp. F3M07]